jgi:hypothetical protein
VDWIRWRWALIYLAPAIPLVIVWQSVWFNTHSKKLSVIVPAAISTASVVFIALAFINVDLLGRDYSALRGWIIVGNLLATILCGIVSFMQAIFLPARRLHILIGTACIVLGLCWLLTLAANVAV